MGTCAFKPEGQASKQTLSERVHACIELQSNYHDTQKVNALPHNDRGLYHTSNKSSSSSSRTCSALIARPNPSMGGCGVQSRREGKRLTFSVSIELEDYLDSQPRGQPQL